MIWVISLNRSLGHVYSYDPRKNNLTLLKTIDNPKGQLKEGELLTDRPGHYQTPNTAKGSYEWPTDPQEVELDRFTKDWATFLKKGLDNHQYKQLILCALPHIGGALINNLDNQVKQTLLANIKKNFVEGDPNHLASYLKENWLEIRSKEF